VTLEIPDPSGPITVRVEVFERGDNVAVAVAWPKDITPTAEQRAAADVAVLAYLEEQGTDGNFLGSAWTGTVANTAPAIAAFLGGPAARPC
jgi:hypothetical protein